MLANYRRPSGLGLVSIDQNEITIYGDGPQTRSFCQVEDLIEGFVRLMHSPDDLTGPLSLGNGTEFTVAELAELTKLIEELTNPSSRLILKPPSPDDPRQRKPGTSLAESNLGWNAVTSLREGLQPAIAYFESLLANAPSQGSRRPSS